MGKDNSSQGRTDRDGIGAGGDVTPWTPGPWTYQEDGDDIVGPEGQMVATTWCDVTYGANTEAANGFLIAAAPEMYEALEELLFENSDKSETDRLVTRLKARAALAKATGQ